MPTIRTGRRNSSRAILCILAASACRDDVMCLALPCPPPVAATIVVTAANAPAGIAGVTMDVSGASVSSGPCSPGASTTCYVTGGPGRYHVELHAPGYLPATRDFTVVGRASGCNTCGQIDAQNLSVELQPTN